MNYRWFPILLLIAFGNAWSYEVRVEIVERMDDSMVVGFISEADIQASRPWTPMKEPVPLDIDAAIGAVRKQLQQKRADPASFSITEIELRQIPQHEGRWHYIVKGVSAGKNAYYFVLMNGKVVPVIREPESYK
ncbi:MAG TPA: hypothetical protein ENK05_13110 [Gammaproteobacteria bacterium]|nr:hypothetical protein [Gammaproteobacteria bacterium]